MGKDNCPFELFKKQLNNKDEYIKTYNPHNGLLRHYWTLDECQHILNHLNGKSCDIENTKLPYKCQLIQMDHKGRGADILYNTNTKINTDVCRVNYKKNIILVKKIC